MAVSYTHLSTCDGILMPELPTEKFVAAIKKVVKANERFIPPYESGAALYIRPLLIGTCLLYTSKEKAMYVWLSDSSAL